jgi:hypothetical protein
MVVIGSINPKYADFKHWKIGPRLKGHAKFPAKKVGQAAEFCQQSRGL